MYNEIKFYISIGIISFLADIYGGKDKLYKSCKEPYLTLTTLFLHHIFASFLYFGWLSNHKEILRAHILSVLFVIFLQSQNNSRCPSTDYVNEKCNEKRISYLRDFLFFSQIKEKQLYDTYIFISFIISCYKLFSSLNKKNV